LAGIGVKGAENLPVWGVICIDTVCGGWYNELVVKMPKRPNYILELEKGDLMRSVSSILRKIFLVITFCALVFVLSGCSTEQMGETEAEGQRRHVRNLRINNQQMMEDIDTFLLLDKPSKLSDKRIP
jgi:hypothetical protein